MRKIKIILLVVLGIILLNFIWNKLIIGTINRIVIDGNIKNGTGKSL